MIKDINTLIQPNGNFRWRAVTASNEATRLGIDNSIKEQYIIDNVLYHVTNLQKIRDIFGLTFVSSWYRTPQLCKAIGSSETSNHITGGCTDIEVPSISLVKLGFYIIENLPFEELIFEYMPNGWIHYASFKDRNSKTIKIKDAQYNFKVISYDEAKKYFKV